MVGIHRLRLAPDGLRLRSLERLIVGGTHPPESRLLSLVDLQSLAENHQRIVTLGERMAEVGTGACTVVSVVHLTIAEVYHQIVLVNHTESHDFGSHDGK